MPALVILLLFANLRAPSGREAASPARIGPAAVFTPGPTFLARFHETCDAKSGPAFGECFVAQMAKAGASPAAIAFARSTGNLGYLREFRESGRVDVAQVEYPFRANESQAWLLVNGNPPMLDVGETEPIRKLLEGNPVYKNLRGPYPKIAVFLRSTQSGPRALGRKDGQRFAVVYDLRDGCRACKSVGFAPVAFDFDAEGRLVGRELGQVRPVYR
jgi:hypothetical protein